MVIASFRKSGTLQDVAGWKVFTEVSDFLQSCLLSEKARKLTARQPGALPLLWGSISEARKDYLSHSDCVFTVELSPVRKQTF